MLLSRNNAPRGKLLLLSFDAPAISTAKLLCAETNWVLASVSVSKDALYAKYEDDSVSHVIRIPSDAPSQGEEVHLPVSGSVARVIAPQERPGVILSLVSWSEPSAYYSFDPAGTSFTKLKMVGDESAEIVPLEERQASTRSKMERSSR